MTNEAVLLRKRSSHALTTAGGCYVRAPRPAAPDLQPAAWGILYLLTPIWTYFIMQTGAGSYVGAINSVLPALMGIFTAWFQKWYPKHVASGK